MIGSGRSRTRSARLGHEQIADHGAAVQAELGGRQSGVVA
jgi:hypothetical protein